MNFMRQVISISVDSKLKNQIEKTAKKFKIPKSFIVKEALKRYFVQQSFRNLREKLVPYAEKKGYFTDEDIFHDKEL